MTVDSIAHPPLDPLHVVTSRLDGDGRYAEFGRAETGDRFVVAEPFAIAFDPADLLP